MSDIIHVRPGNAPRSDAHPFPHYGSDGERVYSPAEKDALARKPERTSVEKVEHEAPAPIRSGFLADFGAARDVKVARRLEIDYLMEAEGLSEQEAEEKVSAEERAAAAAAEAERQTAEAAEEADHDVLVVDQLDDAEEPVSKPPETSPEGELPSGPEASTEQCMDCGAIGPHHCVPSGETP